MTALLARVGALETRLSSQIIWNSGKRKRGDWICTDCRRRGAVKQKRAYSDDTARYPSGLFPSWRVDVGQIESQERARRVSERQEKNIGGWGVGVKANETESVLEALDDEQDPYGDGVDQLWEQTEEAEETEETESTSNEEMLSSAIDVRDDALLKLDYASELGPALVQRSPDMVARCLLAAARSDDVAFIQSIPATSFSECIRLLQPCNVTVKFTDAHLEISEAMVYVFGVSAVDEIAWENTKLLREIKAIRNAAGIQSTLVDYRIFLRAARDLGSKAMADNMWASLLHDGVVPDIQCYNYYMALIVFDRVHRAVTRHKLRVIPFNMLARQRVTLGREFRAFRTGEDGLKAKVVRFLNDMLKNGAVANEESFRIVMTALAREGDIDTVKAILRRMWNIDVDGLRSGKSEEELKPKRMRSNHPLRPTEGLLFAVAHAFGINNDIPTALRLVDFIARHYNMQISRETWNQLFEWTFVLALPRTSVKAKTDGTKAGQLPVQAVMNLWNTMTGAPYFIKPTMGMYNHLMRNLQQRDTVPLMYEKMCEGIELREAEMKKAHDAFRKLESTIKELERHPAQLPSIPLDILRRDYEYLDLIRRRNHFWARRWIRLLLSTISTRILIDHEQDWSLRLIPGMLWRWKHYAGTAGNNIRYDVPGGQLEFSIRGEEEVQMHKAIAQKFEKRRKAVFDRVPLVLGEEWVFRKVDPTPNWAWQSRHRFRSPWR